jgi:hypothetical protein
MSVVANLPITAVEGHYRKTPYTKQNPLPSGSAITRQRNPCSRKSSTGSRRPPKVSIWAVACSMSSTRMSRWRRFLRVFGSGTRWAFVNNPGLMTKESAFKMALWYSPGCKIIVLSTAYVNRSTFQYPEKRVQRCARLLRSLSTSPM